MFANQGDSALDASPTIPGLPLLYGIGATPLGSVLAASTSRGLAAFLFLDDGGAATALARLTRLFPGVEPEPDDRELPAAIGSFSAWLDGGPPPRALPLDLRGTPFQARVWEALQRVPPGETIAYGELAARLGRPGAARAVGAACGANPLAFWVPCHRAVAADRSLVSYRWGLDRKRALLERERRLLPGF